MSKFSEIIEKRILYKAEQKYETFWKDFERFLYQHNIPRDVIFNGLKGHFQKADDKNGNAWADRVKDIFVQSETAIFLDEIGRLGSYFSDKRQY